MTASLPERLKHTTANGNLWQDLPKSQRLEGAMTTMNVSLPDAMKEFIDRQVAERGYQSSSEYVRDLIRREQDRLHVRELILEGMRSPLAEEPIDEAWFERMRARHPQTEEE